MTEEIYEGSSEDAGELIGGLKNAVDKGEDIAKAVQSFLNAGYTKKEIDDAASALGVVVPSSINVRVPVEVKPIQQTPQPVKVSVPIPVEPLPKTLPQNPQPIVSQPIVQPKPLPFQPRFTSPLPSKTEVQKLPTAEFKEPQKLNKTLVTILVLLGIIFVILAGFLGVYWDQLFGPF